MTYVSTVLADGAIGFWELGEPSGTTVTDAAGHSNGTVSGTTGLTQGVTGIPGGGGTTAYQFAAGNKFVSIPDAVAIRVADTFTIEWWMIVGATGSIFCPFAGNTTSSMLIELNTANPPLLVAERQGGGITFSSTTGVPNNSGWHHCVWTKAAATNHLYLDGVDVSGAVTNATCASNVGGYRIGETSAGTHVMNGTLAMVALYSTALSAATVTNHYTLGSSAPPVNTVAPAVTGTTTVGQTLTTTNGTWTGDTSSGFAYQWKDAGGNIASATASTYVTGAGEVGASIHCTVTATGTGGSAATDSNTVGPIAAAAGTKRQSVAPSVAKSIAPSIGGH